MKTGPIECKKELGAVANLLHPIEVRRACILSVIQSDDGRYRLGLHDDGPGFESRRFAASVMARERPPPGPEMRSPAAANGRANRRMEVSKPEDSSETVRELQAPSLRRPFCFCQATAVTIASLAFAGCPR